MSKELFALGCLTHLDIAVLAAYCTAFATWQAALGALNRVAAGDPVMAGLLVRGDGGATVKNPLLAIERHAAQSMMAAAAQFGMTPAARARITLGVPAAGSSKFDGLLAGDF